MGRRVKRSVSVREATKRTCASFCGRCPGLVDRAAPLTCAVADDACRERIGRSLAGRETGGDRRQHLHHQGEQDQRQEFLQTCAHPPDHSFVR